MNNDTKLLKKLLREEIRQKLKAMTAHERQDESSMVCKRAIELCSINPGSVTLAYMPLKTECSPVEFFEHVHENGGYVAFPRCEENGELTLYIPNDAEAWEKNGYGIMEPIPSKSKLVWPDELNLIIVPALGYDHYCGRMGRGGGFYDRLLSKTTAYKLGICFSCQFLDCIPFEPHDEYVDCVITGNGNVYYKNS